MDRLGGLLALFGVASIVLHFMDMNLKILMWIDNWGEGAGWGIRIGLIVVGVALLMLGKKKSPAKG